MSDPSSPNERTLAERFAERLRDADGNPAPVEGEQVVMTVDDTRAAVSAWKRGEAFSVQTPTRTEASDEDRADFEWEEGTSAKEREKDRARGRRQLREHITRLPRGNPNREAARELLFRSIGPRAVRPRRTPAPRAAARRPAQRRTSS